MIKRTLTLPGWAAQPMDIRIGLDVSDKVSHWSAVDNATGEVRQGTVQTTPEGVRAAFSGLSPAIIVFEAGSHSHWLGRVLGECGHRALVVDPAILRQGKGKRRRRNDLKDTVDLMDLAVDAGRPRVQELWQRPLDSQRQLGLMRARDAAVRARSALVSSVRGLVKPFGERVGAHSVEAFPRSAREELSAESRVLVEPLLRMIEDATAAIATYDGQVRELLAAHPHAQRLLQVPGVDQSGDKDPQLRIQKTGDALCRRVLVQCAHYIISRGPDSDLQRWGKKLRGEGKNKTRAKQAAIAVARKLATLLHRLWVSGEPYQPNLMSQPGGTAP